MGNKLGCNVSIDQIEELIKNKVDFIIHYNCEYYERFDSSTNKVHCCDDPCEGTLDLTMGSMINSWLSIINDCIKDGETLTVYVKL